jgi:hypothetical protein
MRQCGMGRGNENAVMGKGGVPAVVWKGSPVNRQGDEPKSDELTRTEPIPK